MQSMNATHDNSYKLLFSHAEMVRDLLLGFVKEEWVKDLDFDTLEKVGSSYVSDDIRDRHDDIVWRVRWGKDWLYVYLLLEFQSSVDVYMSLRLLVYVGLLYQDLIRTKQLTVGGRLPPVLPVVLYNGRPRWQAPVEVSDLIEHVSGGLDRYRPRFSFLVLDEGQYRDEDLKPLKNLVSALFRLENSRKPEQLMEVVTSLLEWLASPEQASLRRAFTVWFNRGLFPSRVGKDHMPEFQELTEVRTMLAETVAEWKAEWEREARAEARAEGRAEGRAEILLMLLAMKFGTFSTEVESRIRSADSESLMKWTERVLTAASLDDIFQP